MSLLYFIIGTVLALIVSRWYKSTKIYTVLLLCLSLGFVVGTSVKGAVANAPETQAQELVTASNPTLTQPSSAVVETVDGIQVMSKVLKSDTVKTNPEKLTTQPNLAEIEDDS